MQFDNRTTGTIVRRFVAAFRDRVNDKLRGTTMLSLLLREKVEPALMSDPGRLPCSLTHSEPQAMVSIQPRPRNHEFWYRRNSVDDPPPVAQLFPADFDLGSGTMGSIWRDVSIIACQSDGTTTPFTHFVRIGLNPNMGLLKPGQTLGAVVSDVSSRTEVLTDTAMQKLLNQVLLPVADMILHLDVDMSEEMHHVRKNVPFVDGTGFQATCLR